MIGMHLSPAPPTRCLANAPLAPRSHIAIRGLYEASEGNRISHISLPSSRCCQPCSLIHTVPLFYRKPTFASCFGADSFSHSALETNATAIVLKGNVVASSIA
jgi:hypothetical protein